MTNPVEPRPARARTRPSWIVLGVFALLTLILTWPVASFLGSRMPGTATWAFDESTFAWNIWYFKHALLDLHTSPLHTELIWYPLGIDLILYTFNFLNAIIALPLLLATNVPLASNVTVLLATILSGFGAYLLTCYVLRSTYCVSGQTQSEKRNTQYAIPITALRLAAILAGIIYAFASNRAIYAALGHYNFATTQWLPFYALYLLKTLRQPRPKNAVLAGFFLALAALTDMTFAALLAMFTLIILLVSWRDLTARWAAVKGLLLAGAVAALIWAPVLIPIAREFVTGNYGVSGWGESVKLSADVVGLMTPTDLNPLVKRSARGQRYMAGRVTCRRRGEGPLRRHQHGVPGVRHAGAGSARSDCRAAAPGRVDLDGARFRRAGPRPAAPDRRPLPVQPRQPAAGRRHAAAAVHTAPLPPVH